MHISVDAVNVMAAYQPVVLACVHCGGRIETDLADVHPLNQSLGLRRRSTAARLLRLWVRIPPGEWMFVCCKCCVLSGRGLCDELITRPEESYRLWCVVVSDLETVNEEALAHWGAVVPNGKRKKKRYRTPLAACC